MYDELIGELYIVASGVQSKRRRELLEKAADAIEELNMKLHGDEAAIAGMKREIERMVVADKPRWIPVTERLPGRHKNVLCCGARGGMFVGWSTNNSAVVDGKAIAYVHGGNGRYVTHWMPLPEPPKEG